MTDLSLIAEGSSFTSAIEEGYPSFEIGIAESKPEKVFFHSIYTKKMQIYFSILARYLILQINNYDTMEFSAQQIATYLSGTIEVTPKQWRAPSRKSKKVRRVHFRFWQTPNILTTFTKLNRASFWSTKTFNLKNQCRLRSFAWTMLMNPSHVCFLSMRA